jgi:8-oxo-dGTP pyrophosphatase MutT (NUDIX family)
MSAAETAIVVAVRQTIENFEAGTPREIGSRRRFLAALDELDHPFDRYANLVHITGSALVLGPRGTILHVHKRLGMWLQPGGHVEPGETPWDAAVRETTEETGLPVCHPAAGPRFVHLDVHPAAGEHVHLDLRYLLSCEDLEPSPPAGESQAVRWFSLDEAIVVADDGLVDGLKRLQSLVL